MKGTFENQTRRKVFLLEPTVQLNFVSILVSIRSFIAYSICTYFWSERELYDPF